MSMNRTPDQSVKAARAITNALYATNGIISHSTARLIAAALHRGPGTALEQLAATGRFDPATLSPEVAALIVEPNREPWRHALLLYTATIRQRRHPWARNSGRGARTPDEHVASGRNYPFA